MLDAMVNFMYQAEKKHSSRNYQIQFENVEKAAFTIIIVTLNIQFLVTYG
jgi:hypothetical protein